MILTHPFLFNSIVVLFIAFTAGWIVSGINSRRIVNLQHKIEALENQKEKNEKKIQALEEQLLQHYPHSFSGAAVIGVVEKLTG